MKCDIHGIAAGPDGRCALCRGERHLADRHDGARLGWILFLGLGTATAALLGWHSLRAPLTRTGPDAQAEAAVATPELAASVSNDSTAPARAHARPAPAPPSFAPLTATVPAAREALAATGDANVPPSAPSGIAPTPSAVQKSPSPEQIRATLLATRIVMYSAAWCGVCRRAEAFLQANGLRYTERDIDANPATLAELKRRTGGGAVPVFEIDGALLPSGFSERSVERALVASVERRLGVRGVRLETH